MYKPLVLPKFLLLLVFIFYCSFSMAQFTVSGVVLDKGKISLVEGAEVYSTGGQKTITDSMGKYRIGVFPADSIYFVYNGKPTQRFAVSKISNLTQFDVSLHVFVNSRYSLLKEVVVYSKNFRRDSIENRETYAKEFGYQKPGVHTSIGPGGSVGADVNELINIFRFKRNKRLKAFQNRLEEQEQEQYINYRFNKLFVSRITGLKSPALDTFLVWYRPSYEFAAASDEIVFNQYILNAYYQFQKIALVAPKKEEETN
jgi:hypothetical protein